MRLRKIALVALVLVFLLPFVRRRARAQEAPEPDRADTPVEQPVTITVTARKREELLQEVAKSVAVVRKQALERTEHENVGGVAFLAPSLEWTYPGNPVESQLIIRGLGAYSVFGEPSVGMFVDGGFLLSPSLVNSPLFDIERVEVLRGPQTALYGKGTLGGAIAVHTKDPTPDPEGEAELTWATDDLYRAEMAVGGPILGDRLMGRAALYIEDFGGFYQNEPDDEPRDDRSLQAGRLTFLAYPTEDIEVRPSITLRKERGGMYFYHAVDDEDDYDGEDYRDGDPSDGEVETLNSTVRTTFDLTDYLSLVALTAVTHADEDYRADVDHSELPPSDVPPFANVFVERDIERTSVAQELRFGVLDDEPLEWFVGLYVHYLESDFEQRAEFRTLGVLPPVIRQASILRSETYALFGHLSWRATEALELSAGARYAHDIRTISGEPGERFDAFNAEATLGWHIIEEQLLAYLKGALAHKPGGFAEGLVRAFDEERLWNVEVGWKSTWLEERLTVNGAFYLNLLYDQQVYSLDEATLSEFTTNGGDAISYGAELELTARPLEELELTLGLAWTEAYYRDFETTARAPDLTVGEQSFDDNDLPYVPRYEVLLGGEYRYEVDEEAFLYAGFQARIHGPHYWDRFNEHRQESYGVLNLHLGFELEPHFSFEVFATNVFDEEYFTNFVALHRTFPLAASHLAVNGPPAQLGVRMRLGF